MKVSVLQTNDVNKLKINDEIFEPIAYKTFRAEGEYISQMYKNGIRLFNIVTSGKNCTIGVPYSLYGESWLDDEIYDFSPVDAEIEVFIKNAPKAYFSLMVHLDTRQWWLDKNSQDKDTYRCLSQMAANEKWRRLAAKYLQAVIRHVEEKYGEKIYSYFILGGHTTEWLSEYDYEESFGYKAEAFKVYSQDNQAKIPSALERELPPDKVFLDPVQDKQLISYRKFHAKLISDTVLYFAAAAQQVLRHNKLIGVYFGYLFELGEKRLWDAGHLDFDAVYKSKDINIIAAPTSYCYRAENSTAAAMCTVDSLRIHNKLFFSEIDERSNLADLYADHPQFNGMDLPDTDKKFIDKLTREFIFTAAGGFGVWWFDMFGGWYAADNVLSHINTLSNIVKSPVYENRKRNSEICVIADAESLYYVNKNSGINVTLLHFQRGELAKIGAPFDIYSASDMESIDFTNYKMVIFLDSFYLTNKQKSIIENKIKNNKRVLVWLFAPNYISKERLSVKGISDITGITVRKSDSKIKRKVDTKLQDYLFETYQDYFFYIEDSHAMPLKYYENNLLCSMALKDCGQYTSVYSATSDQISCDMLRLLAKKANVHVYCEDDSGIVYANNSFIGLYHRLEKDVKINVLWDGDYADLLTGDKYKSINNKLNVPFKSKKCKLLTKL